MRDPFDDDDALDPLDGWDTDDVGADDWRLDVSRITDWLSVGGAIAGAEQMAALRDQGVTHVVSVAWDLDDAALCAAHGLGFYHVPWRDDGQLKPERDFLALLAWVEEQERALAAEGGRLHVYVHCFAGQFRSPLLATFLLAAREGMDMSDAYNLLCERRACVSCFTEPRYRQSCLRALAAAGKEW